MSKLKLGDVIQSGLFIDAYWDRTEFDGVVGADTSEPVNVGIGSLIRFTVRQESNDSDGWNIVRSKEF